MILDEFPLPRDCDSIERSQQTKDIDQRGPVTSERQPTTVDRQFGTFLEVLPSYDERHLTIDEVFHDLRQPTTVDRHFGTLLEQHVSFIERHLTSDETFDANEFIQGGYERQDATSHDQSSEYFNERLADPRATTTSFAIVHDNAQPTTETLSGACSFDYTKLLCRLTEALVSVEDSNISADASV